MENFTDQQIIDEMKKRFIVPRWYTFQDIVDKCEHRELNDEADVNKIIHHIHYVMGDDIDLLIDDEIKYFIKEKSNQ